MQYGPGRCGWGKITLCYSTNSGENLSDDDNTGLDIVSYKSQCTNIPKQSVEKESDI